MDSSINVFPSLIIPSLGINSLILTLTKSPIFNSLERITFSVFPTTKRACTSLSSFCNAFILSFAWPSARDSENVENQTVTNKITAIIRYKL